MTVAALVKEIFTEDLLSDWAFLEKTRLLTDVNFNTACWQYQNSTHKIVIGEKLISRHVKGDLKGYLRCYMRHEFGHARNTERDMKAICKALADVSVPFPLFNLLEDARNEHLEREFRGEPLGWLNYEDMVKNPFKPGSLMFAYIQAEGIRRIVHEALYADSGETVDEEALLEADPRDELDRQVYAYFQELIAAKTTWDVIPIAARWVTQFGHEVPPDYRMSGESDAASVIAKAESKKEGEADGKGEQGSITCGPLASNGAVLSEEQVVELDALRVSSITGQLNFRQTSRSVNEQKWQGRRLSGVHAALKEPPFRVKLETKSKRTSVGLVVDCSSSMNAKGKDGESAMANARYFVAAASALARAGRLSGFVIFSKIDDNSTPIYETWALPAPSHIIERMIANGGGEGLQSALRANLSRLKQVERVIVKTDGCLTDHPLDKAFFRRQGITLEGAYAGHLSEDEIANMLTHFDRVTVRPDLASLALALN